MINMKIGEKINNTNRFFLRGLGLIPKTKTYEESELVRLGMINCYLKDENHITAIERPIYLLFKPRDMGLFSMFVENTYLEGDLKEDFDYPDGQVMLLFEFPKEFNNDYDKLLNGEYSKVSSAYKDNFSKKDELGNYLIPHQVLNKGEHLIRKRMEDLNLDYWENDWEVWEKIDIEKETFKLIQ